MAKAKAAAAENTDVGVFLDVGRNCACFAIRKAARAITQLYDDHLAAVDLKITQFTLMTSIAAFRAVSINKLAATLVMDRTTLTRNIKPLQAAGLVALAATKEDKRVKLLTLTPAGEKKLEAALPHWRKAQDNFLSKIGTMSWGRLSRGLGEAERALNSA